MIRKCLEKNFFILSISIAEMTYIKVPLHTIIKLTPFAYGCQVEEIIVPIAAVDDHELL
jgi:6-phosphofructo-2-kinase/fructose-2,6-biphosphatase 2